MFNYLLQKLFMPFHIILLICGNSLWAQFSIGIHDYTLSVNPSYTVTNGSTIGVIGKFENKGTANINDNVHINLAIDTSSTSTPKYYWRKTQTYAVSSFSVGGAQTFTITDIASAANGYKVGGGGTTIVIWGRVGLLPETVSTNDSAFTNIYIIDVPQNLKDIYEFEQSPIYFKNPITETVELNYEETIYTNVQLNDINGKHIFDVCNKTLIVNELPKGLYLLRFWNEVQHIYVTKRIIIE